MSDQLWSCVAAIVGVPGAITSMFQLLGLALPSRHRSETRFRQLRLWGITWTRLDITEDR